MVVGLQELLEFPCRWTALLVVIREARREHLLLMLYECSTTPRLSPGGGNDAWRLCSVLVCAGMCWYVLV